jgi:Kdo2-lipid A phosphotransferase
MKFIKQNTSLLLSTIILLSTLLPLGFSIWKILDHQCFFFFNKLFQNNLTMQKIVSIMNSRWGDWIFESIIIFIYLTFSFLKKDCKFLKNLLILILCIATSQILTNIIFRKFIVLRNLSPSYVLPVFIDYSTFDFIRNVTQSTRSFPANHAITSFLCILFSWKHLKGPYALFITLFSCIAMMPRLIVGGHWLSDVMFGALPIASIIFSIYNLLNLKIKSVKLETVND